MKKGLIVFIVVALIAIVAFLIYLKLKTPSFSIEKIDKIKKTGVFKFFGIENDFGLNTGKSVSGKNGYVLTTGSTNGNTVYFKLYKNGKFIKEIENIDFK